MPIFAVYLSPGVARISVAGGVANLSNDHFQVVTTLRNVATLLSVTVNLLGAPLGG